MPNSSSVGFPAELAFSKMAGGGNDFVVVDNRSGLVREPEPLAQLICTRRLSVGADGIILIESSDSADFRMVYYNADGSRADFCANGTRCAARFAALERVVSGSQMTIETEAGVLPASISEGQVTLNIPAARGFKSNPLMVDGREIPGNSILVGVPHYVLFVDDIQLTSEVSPPGSRAVAARRNVDGGEAGQHRRQSRLWTMDIVTPGKAIRHHDALQPDGANVNFVSVPSANRIEVRTYERGVEDETLSCGSGVVASVAVAALLNKVVSPVEVLTRSGIILRVAFELAEERGERSLRNVTLTGDARLVYRSVLTEETLRGFDPHWVRNPTPSSPST